MATLRVRGGSLDGATYHADALWPDKPPQPLFYRGSTGEIYYRNNDDPDEYVLAGTFEKVNDDYGILHPRETGIGA